MSEFRQDPVCSEWTLIVPGRAARPNLLKGKKRNRIPAPRETCPFDNLEKTGNWPPVAAYPSEKKWRIVVLENRYPVLTHSDICSFAVKKGLHATMTGVGRHHLVVTRDHVKNFADIDAATAENVFAVFQEHCREAASDRCLAYVAPFFNWGPTAGASVGHPHYQIIALPIVPAHIAYSLAGAAKYYKAHHRCVRCDVIKEEKTERVRVIAENRHAIAIMQYAGRLPFEVRVLPKRHEAYFHKAPREVVGDVVALVRLVMVRMRKYLGDPDLNFFVHEAPLDKKDHGYHHWHVEIFPRLSVPAGFEFSTGVYINPADPETAAAVLRGEMKAAKYH